MLLLMPFPVSALKRIGRGHAQTLGYLSTESGQYIIQTETLKQTTKYIHTQYIHIPIMQRRVMQRTMRSDRAPNPMK